MMMTFQGIIWIAVVFYSALLGGLLTVVAHRLPIMMCQTTGQRFNLWYPPSHCPGCHTVIAWRYKLPILGFFISRGVCHSCHKPIARQYVITELAFTIAIAILFALYGLSPTFFSLSALVFFGLALALIDIQYLLLPDILVLLLLLCGLTTNYWHTFVTFDQAILGGITGFMLFWLIDLIHKLITHRNGLGFGDVKLMAALGVWVGITGVSLIMLIASLTAVGYAIVTNHRSYSKTFLHRKLPFGPFLLTGGLVCVLAKPYLPFFIGALTS